MEGSLISEEVLAKKQDSLGTGIYFFVSNLDKSSIFYTYLFFL